MSAPLDPDVKTLQRLRQACRASLERYVDEASHCSGQLARLNPGAVDQLGRTNLAQLLQKERKAHLAYVDSRDALLDFVLGSGAARDLE
jgi:hypothetical protein